MTINSTQDSILSLTKIVVDSLPAEKRKTAWQLVALWNDINPIHFWSNKFEYSPQYWLQETKDKLFLNKEIDTDCAWKELIPKINSSCHQSLSKYFNILEAGIGSIYLSEFSNLEFLFLQLSRNVCNASIEILFGDSEVELSTLPIEQISQLIAYCIWWECLKKSRKFLNLNKLFIALDDLIEFNCDKRDLRLESNKITELLSFEYSRILQTIDSIKRQLFLYPKELKTPVANLIEHYKKEINQAIDTQWNPFLVLNTKNLAYNSKKESSFMQFFKALK